MTKSLALSTVFEQKIRDYFAAHEMGLPTSGLYDRVMREVEKPLLEITMETCGGNQLKAAALLGMNRNTLRKKLLDLGLMDPPLRKRARSVLSSSRGTGLNIRKKARS